jgi:hypothetical protein
MPLEIVVNNENNANIYMWILYAHNWYIDFAVIVQVYAESRQ